jgi:chitinase
MSLPDPAGRGAPGIGSLFPRDFYFNIAHEMDPEQDLAEEAIALFELAGWDFLHRTLEAASLLVGPNQTVSAETINFIAQNCFGIELGEPVPAGPVTKAPTAEYLEKLANVRQFAAEHRDD